MKKLSSSWSARLERANADLVHEATGFEIGGEAAPGLGIKLQVAEVGAAEELLPELTMDREGAS